MQCENCGTQWQLGLTGAVCHGCRRLLLNLPAGTLATPGRRLGAFFIDVIVALFFSFTGLGLVVAGIETETTGMLMIGLAFFLALFILSLYFMTKSSSVGKQMLGLKVYSTLGQPLGFWLMALREFIGKMASGSFLYLGYLWLLWDQDVQAWHDKIAGSVVLDTRFATNTAMTPPEDVPPPAG